MTFFALFLEVFRALATNGKDGHRSAMREAARENAASAARTKESAPLASRETRSRGRCPGGYRSPRALLCANDFFAEDLVPPHFLWNFLDFLAIEISQRHAFATKRHPTIRTHARTASAHTLAARRCTPPLRLSGRAPRAVFAGETRRAFPDRRAAPRAPRPRARRRPMPRWTPPPRRRMCLAGTPRAR